MVSPHLESPFHAGERAAQARLGLAEKLEPIGQRIIRPYMPDEHRELFEKLPYLVVGVVDASGQPYATLVAGEAGFVRTPDDRTLQIGALPRQGDPVRAILEGRSASGAEAGAAAGAEAGAASGAEVDAASACPSPPPGVATGGPATGVPIGVLGIELSTRRRNRANGVVTSVDASGFGVAVRQSFGNCPKYIQVRRPLEGPGRAAAVEAGGPARRISQALPEDAAALVRNADTFFLASTTPAPLRAAAAGADVSHRGGPPGFVALERDPDTGAAVLTVPDYQGNFLFNTLGNLALEPRCGLVFPDFETGALLSLTGLAAVLWDDPRAAAIPGAQRLLQVRITSATWIPGALPWRFSPAVPSPYLP